MRCAGAGGARGGVDRCECYVGACGMPCVGGGVVLRGRGADELGWAGVVARTSWCGVRGGPS